MINLQKVGPDYSNVIVTQAAAVTLFHLPKEPIDCSFWKFDRKLLMSLETQSVVLPNDKSGYAMFTIPLLVEEMFGIHRTTPIMLASKPLLTLANLLPELRPSNDRFGALLEALNQTIADFEVPNPERAYLIAMHEPEKIDHVYMTMSIRILDENTAEHRHIQQSVRALIEPKLSHVWGYNVTEIPRQMSLCLHGAALKMIDSLHPKIDTLVVQPIISMANILYKNGYTSTPDQCYATLTGEERKRLMKECQMSSCIQCQAVSAEWREENHPENIYCDQKCQIKYYSSINSINCVE